MALIGKGRVCVTGGTGFLGSWIVKRLLEDGYSVNATARIDPERKRDLSYLTNLPGASERLQIFNADLDKPESFAPAIEGCIGVFHTAHPLDIEGKEPEETKTGRGINAVHGILQACLNSKTVKRVVLTSSFSTCVWSGKEPIDDDSWTDVNLLRSLKLFIEPYVVTKVLTEKAAWEFAKKHGIDMVSVHPTWVTGPFICPNVPDTVALSLSFILGLKDFYQHLKDASFVHVDDVARAHIHVFEQPNAEGRYICTGVDVFRDELCKFFSAKYPQYQLPAPDSWNDVLPIKSSGIPSKKLLESGFKYENGVEEMFVGAIECCKQKGLL